MLTINTVPVVITPVVVLTVVTIGDAKCFTLGLGKPIIRVERKETERVIGTKNLAADSSGCVHYPDRILSLRESAVSAIVRSVLGTRQTPDKLQSEGVSWHSDHRVNRTTSARERNCLIWSIA